MIPGGAHTYAKGTTSIRWRSRPSSSAARAATSTWDLDGRELHRVPAWGFGLGDAGHAYPSVVAAASAALPQWTNFNRTFAVKTRLSAYILGAQPLLPHHRPGDLFRDRTAGPARPLHHHLPSHLLSGLRHPQGAPARLSGVPTGTISPISTRSKSSTARTAPLRQRTLSSTRGRSPRAPAVLVPDQARQAPGRRARRRRVRRLRRRGQATSGGSLKSRRWRTKRRNDRFNRHPAAPAIMSRCTAL